MAGEDPGCTLRLALVGTRAAQGCRNGRPSVATGALLVGALLSPLSHLACPSEAPAPIHLPCPPACGFAQVFVWGVTCPPSSPAQGSSSKAWHRLSFLQNSHNNNINNRLDVVGLGRCPAVLVGPAAAYEGQGRVLAPAWAPCCRSSGCGGGPPGWAECSTRFLRQPAMPEENLPLVSVATWGAPPM